MTDSRELKPCDNVWCYYYNESCNGNCWYYGKKLQGLLMYVGNLKGGRDNVSF